jgi:hypothetical protein
MSTQPNLVQPFSEITPQPIKWLMPGRLAHGKLSLFDGNPGLGKSLVTLDLAARITTGRPLPDCTTGTEPANVIILNAEDGPADTISPRLQALGANLDRVFQFRKGFLDEHGPFRLPNHTGFLRNAIKDTTAVLVVLDPLVAFFDASVQINNDMSVRRALIPLAELADQCGVHVAMIRHLNKQRGFEAMYRGGGSIGLLASSRSAFLFSRDPDDSNRTIIAQIKNNLAPPQPSLTYRIESNQAGDFTGIQWLEHSNLTAGQLLAAAGIKPPGLTAIDRAKEFLLTFLGDGPRSTLDIADAARPHGHSDRTLDRARGKLGITYKRVWVKSEHRSLTFWSLPGQKLPADIDPPNPDRDEVLASLDEIMRQYPPDPLDVNNID